MILRIVLLDYFDFNVIFVLVEKVAVFLILTAELRIILDLIRILVFLINLIDDKFWILILRNLMILQIVLIVVVLLDCVDVSFLSFISIIIVSILIVSRSFEKSILRIVIFLFCRLIIVRTKCEIFNKTKEIRFRREREFFWWIDCYLKLWFRCVQLLFVWECLLLWLIFLISLILIERLKTIEIDRASLIDALIRILNIILIKELLINSRLIVRVVWISNSSCIESSELSIDQFSSNVLLVIETL